MSTAQFSPSSILLQAEGIKKSYGGVQVLRGVSIEWHRGQTVGLIGSNGAGKTTLLNILTGQERADRGSIRFYPEGAAGNACRVAAIPPHKFARLRMARTFQNLRLFHHMTVWEHCSVARRANRRTALSELQTTALLKRLGLWEKRWVPADDLAYGEMRRLELARALSGGSRYLFLDEPAAGMTEQEAMALCGQLQELKREYRLSLMLIEHNMELIRHLCDTVYAMDRGEILAFGAPQEVLSHPAVCAAMLGTTNDMRG